MLQNLKDALACLLLLAFLFGTVAAEWWLDSRSSHLDAIILNLESTSGSAQSALGRANAILATAQPLISSSLSHVDSATGQASQMLGENRRTVQTVLLHADEAVGETARTAKHVAAVSQDWADDQKAVSGKTLAVLGETQSTIGQARITFSDLDRQITDPNIAGAFADIHFATTQFSGTMANVNQSSNDLRLYVHRLTKPASTAKTIGLHILGFSEGVVAKTIP